MACRSQAENVTEFSAEINIHFPAKESNGQAHRVGVPEARGLLRLRLYKFYASRTQVASASGVCANAVLKAT
jgi:hypothetical protein